MVWWHIVLISHRGVALAALPVSHECVGMLRVVCRVSRSHAATGRVAELDTVALHDSSGAAAASGPAGLPALFQN